MEDSVFYGKRADTDHLKPSVVHGARPCRLVKVVWISKKVKKELDAMIDLEHLILS